MTDQKRRAWWLAIWKRQGVTSVQQVRAKRARVWLACYLELRGKN